MNIKLTVPFFMVADMAKSLDFYRMLGFTLTREWTPRGKIEWCWIVRDAVALMLQEPASKSHPLYTTADKKGFGVSICFQCEDALALYHEWKEKGLNPEEPFVGNNMWVCCINDPDGYRLDFESPTDVAEETKYSDYSFMTR